jgi:hypothetical protein
LTGSSSSVISRWQEAILSPSPTVVGQPLPHCSPCCWRRAIFLQAVMPMWRSFDPETVCSRCSTPSGVVPGGGAFGRARRSSGCGGEGARKGPGPDRGLAASFRVLFAFSQGLVVILFYFKALCVNVLHRRF